MEGSIIATSELSFAAPQVLVKALAQVNYRLKQKLDARDVVAGIQLAALKGVAVLLQPGHSGYNWSTRKVPLVFIAPAGGELVVRMRQGFSYRNTPCTPNCWPELRGFPGGAVDKKITAWTQASDAIRLPMNYLGSESVGSESAPACRYDQWELAQS